MQLISRHIPKIFSSNCNTIQPPSSHFMHVFSYFNFKHALLFIFIQWTP